MANALETPTGYLEPDASPAKAPDQKPPLRVLVVDDGRNAADILAMFFEIEGHAVKVAYDGHSAIALAKSFKPQFILMDISMPEMDGLEATRRIRSMDEGKSAVIIALSGFDDDSDRLRSIEAGFDRHVSKPVSAQELRVIVTEFETRFF